MDMDFASLPKKMAFARLGYAVGSLLAPKLVTASLGAKPSQMTPAAMAWAGVFASRAAALGLATLSSEEFEPALRRKVLLMNAAIDAVDTVAIVALAKRQRNILPLVLVGPIGAISVYAHLQAARQVSSAPGANGQHSYENAYATA